MVALDYEDGVAASISHSHSDYYPAANPNGYISGITSTMVTNALGYTPGTSNFIGYSSSNKLSTDYINNVAGWTSNSGTMTGVTAGAGLNTTSNDTTTDGGTISNSGTLYLTKSGVTAGTYQGITVDKYGRVTSASNQGYGTYSKPSGGIPSTDLADSYLKLDGTTTMTGALQLQATGNNQSNIGSNGIRWNSTSLPEQTSPQYFCVIDGFANGGRQKWASLANVKSALGVPSAVTESTVSGWGFTKNVGTVTEVSAGTGLNISGTATVSPTVNVDSNYKLQTTQEWKNSSIYSVVSGITTTAGNASSGSYLSVKWTVDDVEGITEPYDGMKILVRIPLAGVGTAGVVLSIDGGTTYHPVAYNVNTALTTHYPVNTNKVFVYNATQKMNGYLTSNTVTNITGVWQGESNYDSNTTITYGTLAYYFRPYAAQAIYRYKFVMLDDDNRLVPLTTTNVSSGDSVTTNQTPTALSFRPDKIYWYNATATINAGSVVGGNTLVDIGYNANNTTNGGMARCNFNAEVPAYRMIYLCGTYNTTTGLFSLRGGGTAGSTAYYTFVPTNSANITLSSYFTSGYDYILLGGTYSSATYIHLRDDHPMYHFDGTNLVPYDTWNENRIEALIPNNYITSITSTDITNALGYTPGTSNFTGYTSSNKLSTNYINNVAGWTANAGTVTSVTAGDGLVIAEDETVNPIVCIDSDYKLPTTTEWSSVATNVAKTNADNSFSVAQTFKDITLYSASGDSPRLTFQRGTLTDTYNDWSLYDSGGLLYIQQRGSGSSSWETRATFTQSAANFAGTLQQGGVNVVTTSDSQALTNKTYNGYTLGAACAKALASSISSTDTGLVTAAQVAGALANVSGGGLNVLQADYLYDIDEGDWATSVTSEQHDAIILADVLAVTDDGSQITYFYKVDVEQANSGDTYVFEGVYSSGINLRLSFNSTNDVDSQYIQTATYRHTLSYSATSISSGTFSGSGKLIVINNSKSAINLWSANVAKGAVITHLNANNNQTGAAFYLGTMSVYGNMRGPMFLVVSGFNATSGTFSSMQVLEMNGLTISSDVVEEI